jgi:hypothetical protein
VTSAEALKKVEEIVSTPDEGFAWCNPDDVLSCEVTDGKLETIIQRASDYWPEVFSTRFTEWLGDSFQWRNDREGCSTCGYGCTVIVTGVIK